MLRSYSRWFFEDGGWSKKMNIHGSEEAEGFKHVFWATLITQLHLTRLTSFTTAAVREDLIHLAADAWSCETAKRGSPWW